MVLPLPPRAPHRKKIKWSLPHAEYYNLGMTKKPSPPSQYQLIASLRTHSIYLESSFLFFEDIFLRIVHNGIIKAPQNNVVSHFSCCS